MVIVMMLLVLPAMHGQKVYEHNYLVKVGDSAPDFTVKEVGGEGEGGDASVYGRIIFLTRLFEREEFDKMKSVIFSELAKK